MQTIQKILKVKSLYQSDIQGKGNLGAKTDVFREPKFTWVQGALFICIIARIKKF